MAAAAKCGLERIDRCLWAAMLAYGRSNQPRPIKQRLTAHPQLRGVTEAELNFRCSTPRDGSRDGVSPAEGVATTGTVAGT